MYMMSLCVYNRSESAGKRLSNLLAACRGVTVKVVARNELAQANARVWGVVFRLTLVQL